MEVVQQGADTNTGQKRSTGLYERDGVTQHAMDMGKIGRHGAANRERTHMEAHQRGTTLVPLWTPPLPPERVPQQARGGRTVGVAIAGGRRPETGRTMQGSEGLRVQGIATHAAPPCDAIASHPKTAETFGCQRSGTRSGTQTAFPASQPEIASGFKSCCAHLRPLHESAGVFACRQPGGFLLCQRRQSAVTTCSCDVKSPDGMALSPNSTNVVEVRLCFCTFSRKLNAMIVPAFSAAARACRPVVHRDDCAGPDAIGDGRIGRLSEHSWKQVADEHKPNCQNLLVWTLHRMLALCDVVPVRAWSMHHDGVGSTRHQRSRSRIHGTHGNRFTNESIAR